MLAPYIIQLMSSSLDACSGGRKAIGPGTVSWVPKSRDGMRRGTAGGRRGRKSLDKTNGGEGGAGSGSQESTKAWLYHRGVPTRFLNCRPEAIQGSLIVDKEKDRCCGLFGTSSQPVLWTD